MDWIRPDEELTLDGAAIHVWKAPLECSVEMVRDLHELLTSDERERAGKFRSPIACSHYIICRGILRRLVASYQGCAASAVEFAYGQHGKPALRDESQTLSFNLAHSSNMALFAFARNRVVGVDLECVRPKTNYMKVAQRFFAEDEVEELVGFRGEVRTNAFFQGWARKEAYLKAQGGGISMRLNHFSVSMDPENRESKVLIDGKMLESWRVYSLSCITGFSAAIATDSVRPDFAYYAWQGE